MVKVAIANAVYPPEPVVSAQNGKDLATYLASLGAHVTVVCPFPSRGVAADASARKARHPERTLEQGVHVIRIPSFASPRSRLIPRMWESHSFGRHACHQLAESCKDIDVLYVNAWPMLAQGWLALFARRRRIPLVIHIKDVYPESLLRRLPSTMRYLVAKPLVAVDRWIAAQAHTVVVLSENVRRVYVGSRRIPEERVITQLDWIDDQLFESLPARSAACQKYGIDEERFTFLYLGNIGPVAGVEFLIETFSKAALRNAQLVIAGSGSRRAACMQWAENLGARHVSFISDPEFRNVPLLQSLAHVCLLPIRRGGALSSVPSKLMAYLLSARPVLATVDADSDTARCIRDGNCGWVGEPENVDWLTQKMHGLESLPTRELTALGRNGREYGLRHFSKSQAVERLASVLLRVRDGSVQGIAV